MLEHLHRRRADNDCCECLKSVPITAALVQSVVGSLSRFQRARDDIAEKLLTSAGYPIFIPAIRRMKLPLPICLNIFRIWAYWRSKLLTS